MRCPVLQPWRRAASLVIGQAAVDLVVMRVLAFGGGIRVLKNLPYWRENLYRSRRCYPKVCTRFRPQRAGCPRWWSFLMSSLDDRRQKLMEFKGFRSFPTSPPKCSPSETPRMIHRKLKQYFAAGVKEVWLIDPEACEVEVWKGASLPDHALASGNALTSALLPGFALPLEELFA